MGTKLCCVSLYKVFICSKQQCSYPPTGTENPTTVSMPHLPYVITDRPLNGKYISSTTSSNYKMNLLVLTLLVMVAALWY